MTIAKTNKDLFEQGMKRLADKTNLTHDGSDDNRLFYDDEDINVFAHLMSKEHYAMMEKELDSMGIERAAYSVSAWNDNSGYKYWKGEGLNNSSNYIKVTAYIIDPKRVRPEQLIRDVKKVFERLWAWDNTDEFYSKIS